MVLLSTGVGSKVLGSGGLDISGLHRNDSSVGVTDESSVGVGVVGSVGSNRVDGASGSSVSNLGSVDLSSVDWHHSSVSVTDQSSGDSVSIRMVGSIGVAGSVGDGTSSLSVGQSGSGNLGGLCWDDGPVGVGHQLGGADGDSGGENLEQSDMNISPARQSVGVLCLRLSFCYERTNQSM